MHSKCSELLIQNLLNEECKWCKRAFGRDKNWKPVYWDDYTAISWSLYGAIWKCYPSYRILPYDKLKQYRDHPDFFVELTKYNKLPTRNNIFQLVWSYIQTTDVAFWNDRIATFRDVRKLVETLNI